MSRCKECGAKRRRIYTHGKTITKRKKVKFKDKRGKVHIRIEFYKGKAKGTTKIKHKINCSYNENETQQHHRNSG